MSNRTYIHIDSPHCIETLTRSILEQIQSIDKAYDEICIACIGSDRATGDCLGPLVGLKLSGIEGIKVRGTLDDTLHAVNLIEYINTLTPNKLIIAVDACLGGAEKIGNIVVRNGSLNPGAGVDKHLPPIGDINIVGIVNVGGFMEYEILKSTRLSIVMKMADVIASGLRVALSS